VTLKGSTFIVTGASSGIGAALAMELARAGANLVLNAHRASLLAEVARKCKAYGTRVEHAAGDAASAEIAQQAVKKAIRIGNFHGFVHNAGVARPGPFLWELPEQDFNEVLAANLAAGYQLVRFAVPELLKKGEGIAVFLGSAAAAINFPGIGAYCVAKAAEEHLARQLAAEAPQIVTFVYRPGIVDTSMQKEAREARGSAAEFLHREFRAYKDQGMLISPVEAAAGLARILSQNPARFHGKVCTWRNGV
jgi:NAD(P)-dependent dehydrogenase (short-subunit alcohol dehydrogenase family)